MRNNGRKTLGAIEEQTELNKVGYDAPANIWHNNVHPRNRWNGRHLLSSSLRHFPIGAIQSVKYKTDVLDDIAYV